MSTRTPPTTDHTELAQPAETTADATANDLSRRGFLGRAGGVAAATVAAGALGGLPLAKPAAAAPAQAVAGLGTSFGGRARAGQAFAIREACATAQGTKFATIRTNGDEELYASRIGSSTKGLPHDTHGLVDPDAYASYLTALLSTRPTDFEAIPMGGKAKFANPQAAYAYLLEGTDPAALAVPPAPAFASAWEAGEMAELYWQALARDVPFATYATDPTVAKAAADLSRLSDFRGPKENGAVTVGTAFRIGLAGEANGPYLSQFLWQPVPYGAMTIAQRYNVARPKDFMTTWDAFLTVQRGRYAPALPVPGAPPPPTRYMVAGRDLATFLHADFIYQAYLNAGLILVKLGALDAGNPYLKSKNQAGVSTFGPQHLLDLVAKVAAAAVKASWYHKWVAHRRVRPEEFGGRVYLHKAGIAESPIHADLLSISGVLDAVSARYGNSLLPLAYPEGCPLHPSYPGAHPAITGACVTILKAFFDEAAVIPNPVIANADGSALLPYSGPPLTVGGELNKLAGNLAAGRAFGGVHWRSDNLVGLQLGEALALSILADERLTYNETFHGYSVTTFDGHTINA